jgi:hypothetical protein
VDQVWRLPPSVHDFLPPGHPAHRVRELVRRELDLAAILTDADEALTRTSPSSPVPP